MTRTDQALLECQMPICYRPNDLGKLLELASRHASGGGEQVLRWHRLLTPAERAAIAQYFLQFDYAVEWIDCDELKVR